VKNTGIPVIKVIEAFKKQLAGSYSPQEILQFVYLLFHEWKGWNRAQVHLESRTLLAGEELTRFLDALARLESNLPIQYIIGETSFLGTRLKVRPGILIPRPETEELAALILRDHLHTSHDEVSLLDIGTGSGCLAIALKKQMPWIRASATDISETAVNTATENAILNGSPVTVFRADILDRTEWGNLGMYSIIVSNPPYVTESDKREMRPNVLDHEPHEALFVKDEDPLVFYKAIAGFAAEQLLRPGQLYLEINERFGNEVRDVLLAGGFKNAAVLRDLHGKDRFVRSGLDTE
jgi:release factor glutamine methyltransferase